MVMTGLPTPLFMASITAVVLIALAYFFLFPWRGKGRLEKGDERSYRTYDLLKLNILKRLVSKRSFQFSIQLPLVLLFMLVIFAGLFGTQLPSKNIAPILTWTIWWVGIVFAIVLMGKIWCLMCPWVAIGDWLKRFSLWKKVNVTYGFEKKWPQRWRNIYAATLLFILLTWLELGFGVTYSPRASALLGLLMLIMVVGPLIIFERKSFCRYACLVGRISGLYALFSACELRSKDREICKNCKTSDCLRGNDKGYGCPTFEYLGNMELNTYCILCSECVKTCPHDNVAFNLRPFAVDLTKPKRLRPDEAYLALIMLSLAFFHGISMTPYWPELIKRIAGVIPLGHLAAFTLGMLALMALPSLIYLLFAWLSKLLSGNKGVTLKRVAINFAYAMLPVALLYHLAHNTQHLLREGASLIPVLSDPFGWGWDLFGTANWQPKPILSMTGVWYGQIFFIIAGAVYGLDIASKLASIIFPQPKEALKGQLPILLLVIGFTILSLWLIHLPMQSRTAM